MGNTLYIVRVWPELRYVQPYSAGFPMCFGVPISAAFFNFADAQDYTQTNTPINLNPFTDAYPGDEEEVLTIFIRDVASDLVGDFSTETRDISLKSLNTFIREQELTPPKFKESDDVEEIYKRWWDKNAPHMTTEQKTALWRFLIPMPYDIIEVTLVTDTGEMG